jgi:hypothetical protein
MGDINVTITEREIIHVTMGCGGTGTSNHAALTNLDYDNANHTGFQKKIDWDDDYNAFLVDKP